jgi:hypothetical protein
MNNLLARRCILLSVLLVSTFLLSSCGLRVTKGDAYQTISKVIRVGADRAEVLRFIESLEVNGVKPSSNGYIPAKSPYTVVAPHGKKVEVAGDVAIFFENGASGHFFFCPSVFAIFYFDKSGKLITYVIDC